jgi:hypothetical protein
MEKETCALVAVGSGGNVALGIMVVSRVKVGTAARVDVAVPNTGERGVGVHTGNDFSMTVQTLPRQSKKIIQMPTMDPNEIPKNFLLSFMFLHYGLSLSYDKLFYSYSSSWLDDP